MTTSFPPINYPNKPVPPFTAEPPRNSFPGFFPDMWKNITGKPYITVSSKGLANGQSEYINDGADFGPDSLQADGTLTQTAGVNESVNYAISAGGGHIIVRAGNYNIGGQFSSDANALISIPAIANGLHIEIEGEYEPMSNVNYQNVGGVNFIPTVAAPSSPDSFTYPLTPAIFGVAPQPDSPYSTENNPVVLTFKNIGFKMPDNPTLSCINAVYAYGLVIDNVLINNINGSVAEVTNQNAVGVIFPYSTNNGYVKSGLLVVSDMYLGAYIGSHTYIDKTFISYCQIGITGNITEHGAVLGNLDIGSCPYIIGGPGFGIQNDYSGHSNTMGVGGSGLLIKNLEISVSAPSNWYYLQSIIYPYNNTSPRITILNIDLINNDNSNTLNDFMTYISQSAVANLKIVNSYRQNPSISVNPPVSGTAYQNTNPYAIEIDLPVYATTAGTAGYVTIAKGATSTPTAIGSQFVSGSTSSTSTDIIKLRVPAGWYYSFTGSGVTFTTATPFAE